MSEKLLANRGRALEEEYFRKQDRALIEKMRRRSELEVEQQEMAASVGITDPQVMLSLAELGYTRETISLLYFVPMIQVAWSDGSISKRERGLILKVAESHGLKADSPAHQQPKRVARRETIRRLLYEDSLFNRNDFGHFAARQTGSKARSCFILPSGR